MSIGRRGGRGRGNQGGLRGAQKRGPKEVRGELLGDGADGDEGDRERGDEGEEAWVCPEVAKRRKRQTAREELRARRGGGRGKGATTRSIAARKTKIKSDVRDSEQR